jgi:hypothetical protein
MSSAVAKLWAGLFACSFVVFLTALFLFPELLQARNINEYKDTISTSAPSQLANHTLSFRLDTAVSPGGYIEVVPPAGFSVISSSSFNERTVELVVDGTPRVASTTLAPGVDQVDISPGSPGLIRYTLEPTAGLSAGSQIQLKLGDHTSVASVYTFSVSTTTGTSTTPEDTPGIVNSSSTGTHIVDVRIYDGGEVANAGFSIAIVEQVGVGPVDTTETIPPFRFNAAPTSTVGGTTLSVEISLETDEFATCKYSASSSVAYGSMPTTFSNTGLIFHTTIVQIVPNSVQRFYVRCMDDEGNFNIDDFEITFTVNDIPTGQANTDGDVSGDGSGDGNDGSGDGSGSGGTTGDSNGEAPLLGGSAGTGGSGGGGGGGRGGSPGGTAGGGFESTDGPYRSGDGRVVITGYAYPRAKVTVLVDGKQAEQVTAGNNGLYEVTLDQIARGVYTFGVFATDAAQVKSSTFSTSFTVSGARTTALSNINISPSIKVTPDPVTPGTAATISGYAMPNATITIENEKQGSVASRKVFTATSDAGGAWSVPLDTNGFTNGTYKVRARALQEGGATTNFSSYTLYGVGEAADRRMNADLNTDGRVNLTDFSILLFWWASSGGDSNPPADINGDTRVNLTDFSILLFNWTG